MISIGFTQSNKKADCKKQNTNKPDNRHHWSYPKINKQKNRMHDISNRALDTITNADWV